MYRVYEVKDKKQIIVVSTYAGKTVKGIATCAPEDEYSYEKGIELAMARCNAKVATKRTKNARKKFNEARLECEKAKKRLEKMQDYVADAIKAENDAYFNLMQINKACR